MKYQQFNLRWARIAKEKISEEGGAVKAILISQKPVREIDFTYLFFEKEQIKYWNLITLTTWSTDLVSFQSFEGQCMEPQRLQVGVVIWGSTSECVINLIMPNCKPKYIELEVFAALKKYLLDMSNFCNLLASSNAHVHMCTRVLACTHAQTHTCLRLRLSD